MEISIGMSLYIFIYLFYKNLHYEKVYIIKKKKINILISTLWVGSTTHYTLIHKFSTKLRSLLLSFILIGVIAHTHIPLRPYLKPATGLGFRVISNLKTPPPSPPKKKKLLPPHSTEQCICCGRYMHCNSSIFTFHLFHWFFGLITPLGGLGWIEIFTFSWWPIW